MFASRLTDTVIGDPAGVGLVAVTARDLRELDGLMHDPEVAEWWPDYEIDDFREYLTHAYVAPFRIVAANKTVGFLQVYHANRDEFWTQFGVPAETFGLDLAIGDAAARERGVGRAVLRLMIERLFQWPEVVRVRIDPDPENERAIRAFAAAGFVARGVYPGYEDDPMLYMTVERQP
jgi:RimJ/RimL family protein N-acetyltransferase